ncbi:unnamed protein product [marine sediment metagenome]|uniref:Uncharacterized protein n=1 Tax=marine sediment metagenome TaxID=412755 RepID=X1HJA3_9ZZZZ
MPTYPAYLEGNVLIRHGGLFMPGKGNIKLPKGADVASVAGAIAIGSGVLFDITGTLAITDITPEENEENRLIILRITESASMVDGSHLKLEGDFAPANIGTIGLYYVETSTDIYDWYELFRTTIS